MAKKFGFVYSESDEEDNSRRELLKLIHENISSQYSPTGETADKVYKKSEDLIYDLSDIVPDVTPMDLAQVIRDEYRIEYVCGVPYWVLYEKNPLI